MIAVAAIVAMIAAGLEPGTVGVVLALVGGVGGAILALYRAGPERTRIVVAYQASALESLQSENRRLIRENGSLRERLAKVEEKAAAAEARVHDLARRLALIEEGRIGTRRADRPDDLANPGD